MGQVWKNLVKYNILLCKATVSGFHEIEVGNNLNNAWQRTLYNQNIEIIIQKKKNWVFADDNNQWRTKNGAPHKSIGMLTFENHEKDAKNMF